MTDYSILYIDNPSEEELRQMRRSVRELEAIEENLNALSQYDEFIEEHRKKLKQEMDKDPHTIIVPAGNYFGGESKNAKHFGETENSFTVEDRKSETGAKV